MAITLTEDERWSFLRNGSIMRLSTVTPDCEPHIAPVWYLAERDDDAIYATTPSESRKVRNVKANPEVSLTVDEGGDEYFELRAVVIEGEASLVRDDEKWDEIERRWCRKYFDRSERPDHWDLLYEGKSWEWMRITPKRWMSWDNSRIDVEKLRRSTE